MQYQNMPINGPYIGLILTFAHISPIGPHKTMFFDIIHLQIAKIVEK